MPGHVLFCSDDRGFSQLRVAMYSLLRSASADRRLSVSVFTGCGKLSEEHTKELRAIAQRFSFATLSIFDVDPLLLKYQDAFAAQTQWGPMMWARCFIGEIFPEEVRNVVYLDIDTLVCHDLGELYDLDMSNRGDGLSYVLGAVCEESRETAASDDPAFAGGLMPLGADRYFNSGFLVMNAGAFRSEGLLEKLVDWYVAHKAIAKRPDQDTLNAYFHDRTLFLHPKYNHCDGWLERQLKENIRATHWRGNKPSEILEAILEPRILHFWGRKKPWLWNHRPEGRRYEDAMRELGWVGDLPGTTFFKKCLGLFFRMYHMLLRRIVVSKLRKLANENH